jgi:ABC-2 type transport system permease protein
VRALRALARQLRRQLAVQARMDLLVMLGSKGQALIWAVSDLVTYGAGIAAVLLLAERFDGLAGWTQPQLTFLVGYSGTVGGMSVLFFNYNIGAISRRIGRGQLDHTLLQPRPLLLALLTEGFSPVQATAVLTPSAALLLFGASIAKLDISAAFTARLLVSLLSSLVVVTAGSMTVGALAFWAPRGAEEISPRATRLLHLTELPLDPAPLLLRGALLTAVPAGFVAWFPAAALLGRVRPSLWLLTPLAAVVAAAVATLVFRKGLRHYEHTGSSRYSTFGHRR